MLRRITGKECPCNRWAEWKSWDTVLSLLGQTCLQSSRAHLIVWFILNRRWFFFRTHELSISYYKPQHQMRTGARRRLFLDKSEPVLKHVSPNGEFPAITFPVTVVVHRGFR
jgi:hypothetical protein